MSWVVNGNVSDVAKAKVALDTFYGMFTAAFNAKFPVA